MGKHKDKRSRSYKKEKKHKKQRQSSSSSSSDEWVEKSLSDPSTSFESINKLQDLCRDEWMSLPTSFLSVSNVDKKLEREARKQLQKEKDTYNPRENVRELNPYWKSGGDGLPSFQKPSDDNWGSCKTRSDNRKAGTSNWRKKTVEDSVNLVKQVGVPDNTPLNVLAAKLVKAEILGDTALITELKEKLEYARSQNTTQVNDSDVLLTQTDSKGYSKPFKRQSEYGEYSGGRSKKQMIETHNDGQRVRYFPDDDKYSLKQMFENEKYNTDDSNKQFMELAGRIYKNDDLDDVFADNIRKETDEKIDKRNKDKAISDHRQMTEALDNCQNCLQSEKMLKHLLISTNETIYLSLPHYEPLTRGHCLLVPIRHTSCSTQLDENEWLEILNYRRQLIKLFNAKNEDVIFFESAMYLHRHPHMILHCVPVPKEQGDIAPIYFKKAIDESEMEWVSNKKLVSLAGRDVRRAIPKGLPYFAVSFGMDEGFAHVIEDQRLFPNNFAQEIIGGMLDLHHSRWRKPKPQKFEEQKERVLEFAEEWKKYDLSTIN